MNPKVLQELLMNKMVNGGVDNNNNDDDIDESVKVNIVFS